MSISSCVFRQNDIRGVVPTQLPLASIPELIHAIIDYYHAHEPKLTHMLIGRDGRVSSPAIKQAVISICHERGLTVCDIDLCPTPLFYFVLHTSPITSGIMITASHNTKEYNGFKLRLNQKPVWGKQLQDIRLRYLSYTQNDTPPIASSTQSYIQMTPPLYSRAAAYVPYLRNHFSSLKNNDVHAIIDCGNGAAGPVVRQLITVLNLHNISLLYEEPNGLFPAHEPDPTKVQNLSILIKKIRETPQPTIGFALDGDGDRVSVITEDGTLLPGDELLALLATPLVQQNPGAPVVYDIKSSSRLINHITSLGGTGYFSACGHTAVQEAMEYHQAIIGGETSGHLFFRDRYLGFDDGIYALLRVLELRTQTNKPLTGLLKALPKAYASPELRIPCPEEKKQAIIDAVRTMFMKYIDARLITIDGARIELPHGWGLVRAAHTEPTLSLRFEAHNQEQLTAIQQEVLAIIEKHLT